jgi:hypothetical protein
MSPPSLWLERLTGFKKSIVPHTCSSGVTKSQALRKLVGLVRWGVESGLRD